MKEVGMAQFEAFRSLIQANKLQQTVHLLFVPGIITTDNFSCTLFVIR